MDQISKALLPTAVGLASKLGLKDISVGKCGFDSFQYNIWKGYCKLPYNYCKKPFFLLTEANLDLIKTPAVPKYMISAPEGASFQSAWHYGQNMKCSTDRFVCFRKYDYGREKNLKLYGQSFPPEYNTKLITDRIRLFSGSEDKLVPAADGLYDRDMLPNADVKFEEIKGWGHMTFIVGTNSRPLYERIAKDIRAQAKMAKVAKTE